MTTSHIQTESHATLYYAHDPMCSWCWAFNPTWYQIQQRLPKSINVVRLVGGLAVDSSVPMPQQMQQFLQQTWQRIQVAVPGTEFNFDFWRRCSPRRSTYPACRAVIAARLQRSEQESAMMLAIQQAYYLDARNPSDDTTLVELACEIGLDEERFKDDLNADKTQQRLLNEVNRCREMGAQGFPSLILETPQRRQLLPLDYADPEATLQRIAKLL